MVEDVTHLCSIREKLFGSSVIDEVIKGDLSSVLIPDLNDYYRFKVNVSGSTYAHRIYIKVPDPGLYSFVVFAGVGEQVGPDVARQVKGPYAPPAWVPEGITLHEWGGVVAGCWLAFYSGQYNAVGELTTFPFLCKDEAYFHFTVIQDGLYDLIWFGVRVLRWHVENVSL